MIQIFNTLSGRKEVLKIQKGEQLNLFVCGPTVYDLSHIGHARTYIAFDVIVKYLRQAGLDVYYLQNITDIDDKIIQRALETEKDPKDLARQFEKEYFQDMKSLGIDSVTTYARATDHIREITSQVERLLKERYAYELEGDGIYYDVAKFAEYGKLSHRTTEQAEDAVSKIDESVKKKNKGDFALWKFSRPGEPKWNSSWGWGRPGWHIEDTAITEKYFGSQYDIHGGARDLIFPHHEAEISQMEAISGKKPLAAYWMHTGFLTVSGEKMSKSQGNFITIRDFLAHDSPRLLRLLVAKTHYRSPIDYSEKILEQTKSELARIDEFVARIEAIKSTQPSTDEVLGFITKMELGVRGAMEDDFNTPILIAVLFGSVQEGNTLLDSQKINMDDAEKILEFLSSLDEFLGFLLWGKEEIKIPEEIKKLAEQREKYRRQEDWQKADELRKASEDKGWEISDTSDGPRIKKLD